MALIYFCNGIYCGQLSLELSGFKYISFNEIDKEVIKIYKQFFDKTSELKVYKF